MIPASPFIKVFEGIADRHQMYRLFDRHAEAPYRWDADVSPLFAGEWFEVGEADHDHILEMLSPLWKRDGMIAVREFFTGTVTSIFLSLAIDDRLRWFHGYCDLSDAGAPDRLRATILEHESRPARAMTRDERLEHIWSATHDAYRGYADGNWPVYQVGRRLVILYEGGKRSTMVPLHELTDTQIAAKLPVHLRFLPDAIAA